MSRLVTLMTLVVVSLGSGLALLPTNVNASASVIYNNIPNPLPGNLTSEALEAQSASEFGGQVVYAGTDRQDPIVTVIMSSWGCETGHWYTNDCVTTPGATFSHPITLNIYNVMPDDSVGSLLTTKTDTFNIPYRPSKNESCTDGRWKSGADCFNGFATPIVFDLTGQGVTLPEKSIISVAYNTSHYGIAPLGESKTCYTSSAGCGYDSLNVGLNAPPTIGTDPVPDGAYLNSSWTGAYCSGTTGTFRLDTPCWTGYQPAIKVEASAPNILGKATGGLTLSGPRQQISFNAFDYGASNLDKGNVEYQNFDYPGGLHYTADVLCANVKQSTNEVWFMFQIPAGYPGLSGLYVVSYVKDGGSPGTKGDLYGHTSSGNLATAKSWCENANAPVGLYPVKGGNAVVHKQ